MFDFDVLGANAWTWDEWVIRPHLEWSEPDRREVERAGVEQFELLVEEGPIPWRLAALIRDAATEQEALLAWFSDESQAEYWRSEGWNEVLFEVVPLDVDGYPAVRRLIAGRDPSGYAEAHLAVHVLVDAEMVAIYVDTEFIYSPNVLDAEPFDGRIIVDFAPVLDRYIEILRFP